MKRVFCLVITLVLLSGCSGYRMTSNVPTGDPVTETYPVTISAGDLAVPYEEIGPLEVVVRPVSYFADSPTRREARLGLMQKARQMGATAVIKVTYEERFDLISMGHIAAQGIAVREK